MWRSVWIHPKTTCFSQQQIVYSLELPYLETVSKILFISKPLILKQFFEFTRKEALGMKRFRRNESKNIAISYIIYKNDVFSVTYNARGVFHIFLNKRISVETIEYPAKVITSSFEGKNNWK